MKGISAMIATVLLIAFTIAIGGIVSIWLTGLTNTQTQQVTNQSSAQVKCTPSLSISTAKVPGTAPVGTGLPNQPVISQVNVTFTNPSQQTISSLTALIPFISANNVTSFSATSLSAGGIGTVTAWVYLIPTYVKVSGVCAGLPVSATCDNTMACWSTG